MSEPRPVSGGRRAAETSTTTRPVSLVLAVALPLVVLVAALLVNGDPVPPPGATAPSQAPLTSLQLVCPGAAGGSIGIGTVQPEVGGGISLHLGGSHRTAKVASNRVTWVGEPAPTVLDARQGMAPGLIASRVDERRAAAVGCHEPRPDTWFTGVGAASIHSSTLQLVNPDSGPAIVDVTVYGTDGVIDVRDLRGMTVPGGTVTTIDLSAKAPSRSELAIRVSAARGRIGASLLDSFSERTSTADWISAQYEPSLTNTLVGIASGTGTRTLVVANPSDSEARVQVRIIGTRSTFAPEGFAEISVPPESVVVRNVDRYIGTSSTRDAVGLLVTSTQPVTAAVRSLVSDELSSAVAVEGFTQAGLVVPDGKAVLMVAAPNEAGSAQVTAYAADGKRLLDTRIAAKRLTGATLDLPDGTAYLLVQGTNSSLHGAVRVTSARGVVTLPLVDAVTTGLIPGLRSR